MKIAIKTIGANVVISKIGGGYVVERAINWAHRDFIASAPTFEAALAIAQGAAA